MSAEDTEETLAAPTAGELPGPAAHVYPRGSRINAAGRLEIGGCDTVELARELGTPVYVYAEDDMRARAREIQEAFAAHTDRFEVLYASKAFPCTAALELFAAEGLSCDVASGGELHLALGAGFKPERIYMHGNNKSEAELEQAVAAGVGHVIVDSFDEIDRLERIAAGSAQKVLLRVTPGIEPDTHTKIATGQEDSKFGIPIAQVGAAAERAAQAGLELRGLHAHIGSQIFDLDVYETLGKVLAGLGENPVVNVGGGFAAAYTRHEWPPVVADYAEAMLGALPSGTTVLCEPGRSLVANAGVTLYTVGTVKEIPGVRTYVSVDGGMSDNPRPISPTGSAIPCPVGSRGCTASPVTCSCARPRWRARTSATCWSSRPRGHTVTQWPATTTPHCGPPSRSAATAMPASSCGARPTTT
jgi:diaminopimelate decarboxylase